MSVLRTNGPLVTGDNAHQCFNWGQCSLPFVLGTRLITTFTWDNAHYLFTRDNADYLFTGDNDDYLFTGDTKGINKFTTRY